MTITDDIVKSLRNPTPLYAVAGTADLAAEKLREVPALIGKLKDEAPERIEKIRATDPKVVQERVATQAKDAQSKLNETFSDIDLKELRDFRKLGESVQGFALQGVGRAAEYAVRAREAYDGLAERGKGAVATWRGEAADEVVEIAAAVEPDKQSTAPKTAPGGTASGADTTAKPASAAKRTTPRKPAAPKKAADKTAK
ncbi:hypothetical protein [Actinacidiphila rubida]|uniref:Uncharacterized protein n=1 Tax=Actinacidiphila rubida TaxID=310780 RepID=A0A1H8P2J6_9ACTN|nr:hypothetical protein [Actinacidiphila rubida]SEO36085.1 hypothetical protein SAMN05216267_102471 [Actinacidiphila rubida]